MIYYVGPLVGCLVASGVTSYLLHLTRAQSFTDFLSVGLSVGIGYGATITSVNAIAPNMTKPALYASVVGSYHLVGLALCSCVLYWLAV